MASKSATSRRRLIGISTLALATAIGMHVSAHAQDKLRSEETAPAVPSAAADSTGVEEVIVTARKRTEFARDTPISIASVGGDQLAQKDVARLTDLVTVIPNFSLSLSANQPLTFIRGFGSGGSPVFEQAVGKFVDNISFGRDIDARIPLFDLERVEVLKGPQVLLYGNSATAGALNITTRKPGRTFEADGSAAYDFENQETLLQGGVSVPLGEVASFRVAGFYQDLQKGWIHNVGNGRDEPTWTNFAIRPTLRLDPTDKMWVVLKLEYDRLRDHGAVSQPIRQATSPARAFTSITLDDERDTNYNVAPFLMEEANSTNAWLYQADINYQTGVGTITSTTGYRDGHNVGIQGNASQKPSAIVANGQRFKQFSEELRLAGSRGPIDYLVGFYYERSEQGLYAVTAVNPSVFALPFPAFSSIRSFDGVSRSYSEFANLTYHVTPQFSIEAGARYSQIRKRADQLAGATPIIPGIDFDTPRSAILAKIDPSLNGLLGTVFGAVAHDFKDIEISENHLQPQVVAQYKFSPTDMVYAKFVKGDKSGGVDYAYGGSLARGANVADSKFRPERAVSFEAGAKGLAFDRTLEYSLTAFSTTFTDLQTSLFVGTALFVTNAGKAQSNGVELSLNWAPAQGVRVGANGTWQDAKYKDYRGVACDVQGLLPTSPGGGCNLSGRALPFESRWTGSLSVDYERPVSSGLVLGGGVSAFGRTKYFSSLNNDPLGIQNGFVTLDAHLDLRAEDRSWTLSLFGRNLTDHKYKEYSVATPLVPGGYNVFLSRGTQVGVRFGFALN